MACVSGGAEGGVDVALVYESSDFLNWTVQEKPMRTAPQRAGMWEVRGGGSRVDFGWGVSWQEGCHMWWYGLEQQGGMC